MNLINWGQETPEQLEQRRRFQEEAMEWARAKMVAEAKGKASSSTAVTGGGGGSSEPVNETTTTTAGPATTTTTAAPTTTTTTTETPTTTTTTTEDPNWVQLGFTDWTWVEANIGSRSSVAAWNSALIGSADTQFTSVSVEEDSFTLKLYGGVNVALAASALASSDVVSIIGSASGAIQSIGNSFCSGCTSLQNVDLQSVVTLGNSVFQGCSSIATISFNSLTSIGTSCFEGCSSMTDFVAIGLSTVGDKALKDCTALTTISIGDTTSGGLGSGSNLYSGTDGVFSGLIGNTISLSLGSIPFTATGAFDEDILYIFENNTVTVNSSDPAWVTVEAGSFDTGTKNYTANGTAHGTGSPTIGILGFVINTTGSPTNADTVFDSTSTSLGAFSAVLQLEWSTTYYVRSYIAGSFGTVYSLDEETFTTPADPNP